MKEKILFTSESVSDGHPDKVCDQIADAILDACLKENPDVKVACEVFVTTNYVIVGGEITPYPSFDIEKLVRDVIKSIGYTKPEYNFSDKTVAIELKIKSQSPDIAQAVIREKPEEVGAGDQGIMFGYASNETKGYMPLAISIAHKLMRVASQKRKEGKFKYARPDMKAEVTIDYTDKDNIRTDTVLMSVSHDKDYKKDEFLSYIKDEIMIPVIKSFGLNTDFKAVINPSGMFVICGPDGDTGLTGRKIICDTYGGTGRHGGGSFSGKDPTKVDRSGAYMARYIAKNLVAAGAADRLEVQLSYAIGQPEPISVGISTFGTAHYSDEVILEVIREVFDCRPGMIIKNFSLTKPAFKYQEISNYGHFGRGDLSLPWEKLDKVDIIKEKLLNK